MVDSGFAIHGEAEKNTSSTFRAIANCADFFKGFHRHIHDVDFPPYTSAARRSPVRKRSSSGPRSGRRVGRSARPSGRRHRLCYPVDALGRADRPAQQESEEGKSAGRALAITSPGLPQRLHRARAERESLRAPCAALTALGRDGGVVRQLSHGRQSTLPHMPNPHRLGASA